MCIRDRHIEALFAQRLDLRQLRRPVAALRAGVVDVFLPLGHCLGILLEADQLVLLRRPVEQQILKQLFLRAVIIQHTRCV